MSNQALPRRSAALLRSALDQCQNLGLILDKFAPWQPDRRGQWDLTMQQEQRRRGQTQTVDVTGGQAKGLWLATSPAKTTKSPAVFDVDRSDIALIRARYQRLEAAVRDMNGVLFTMPTAERIVVGLGASHVLETGLTLDRATGAPMVPGSSLKGIARSWALIEVAQALNIAQDKLSKLASALLEEKYISAVEKLTGRAPEEGQIEYMQWLRYIFGTQQQAGQVNFLDAVYAGQKEPRYALDVMTPHFVAYYSETKAPADDLDPNPISFLTVEHNTAFAFGLLPRSADSLSRNAPGIAADWLINGLVNLGAGGKTAAGYGYFNRKRMQVITQPGA